MAQYDNLTAAIATAQKAGDAVVLGTLRLLKNAVDIKVKDGAQISDDLVGQCTLAEIKKRREAASLFRQGGAADKATAEEAEAEIIAPYAPAQLSEDELTALVDQAINSTGATEPSQMGQVMGALRQTVGNRADMGVVSNLVRARLQSKS